MITVVFLLCIQSPDSTLAKH